MSSKILKNAVQAALLSTAVVASGTALAADQELLDMLKANGAITQEQYEKLSAKSDKGSEEMMKKMAWASKVRVEGDIRLRQEFKSGDSKDDRQRVRARLAVIAQVNDKVEAGIGLATDKNATGGNATLKDGFEKKDIFLNLAYLNWQPVEGLELIGGKFKKPWDQVGGGLVWDGDVNPEGGALRYSFDVGGAQLVASAGHLVLDDNADLAFDEDERVCFGQLAGKFDVGAAKLKLGAGLFEWDTNKGTSSFTAIGSGQDTDEFSIQNLFGELNINAGLPLKFYADYARNADASGPNDGEDTAWLVGVGTKLGKWSFDYNYRETELNAVQGAYNDSDFAGGLTDSEGHYYKVAYSIDKNFSVETTYRDAETGSKSTVVGNRDLDLNVWRFDVKAKF